MAISIDLKSGEVTKALERAVARTLLKPNEMHGRVRMCRFTYTTPTTVGVVDGQNIAMCILPKGARILEIFLAFEAMGGSSTIDIGLVGKDGNGFIDDTVGATIADVDDYFAAAVSVVSAGEIICADTIAQKYGYELAKECYLVFTAETDDFDAEKDIVGHVLYVLD